MCARAMLFLGLALAACGKEELELGAPLHDDGGTSAADGAPNGAETGTTLPVGDSGIGCDAGSGGLPGCLALGASCGANSDCCAGRCGSGICLPPGICGAPGVPCTARADCCSGACEPSGGGGARVCLPTCRPDGSACLAASDCCGRDCNGGSCGGSLCAREGSDCTSSAQCCSGVCSANDSKCVVSQTATCRPAGEDCSSGGGGPCCGVCNDTTQRCDVGPGPCRLPGALCTQASDCCAGTCAADASGKQTCTTAPLGNGATCTAGFQCTSGTCTSSPPVCGAPAPACAPSGASCTSAAGCCSGICQDGKCDPACVTAP